MLTKITSRSRHVISLFARALYYSHRQSHVKETPSTKVITIKISVKDIDIKKLHLAILLYEQYIHHTQASVCPNIQFLSGQQYAYQSLLSYFMV